MVSMCKIGKINTSAKIPAHSIDVGIVFEKIIYSYEDWLDRGARRAAHACLALYPPISGVAHAGAVAELRLLRWQPI